MDLKNIDKQAVANAVVKLASDITDAFSIMGAEDFDSEIFTKTKALYDLASKTAYDAENDAKKNDLISLRQVKPIVDAVNELAAIVNKKKMTNPLISDELVGVLNIACKDATNMVSLYATV